MLHSREVSVAVITVPLRVHYQQPRRQRKIKKIISHTQLIMREIRFVYFSYVHKDVF